MLLLQLAFVCILVLIGSLVLILRRKADCSRTGYKLVLLFLGILVAIYAKELGKTPDVYFLRSIGMFLLVILLFELSVRLNRENININRRDMSMFVLIIILNMVVLGAGSSLLLGIPVVNGIVLAIILSSVEYFLVDRLKNEGDLANPLILFFAFSILLFYGLTGTLFDNIVYLVKYIFMGLAVGVLVGIIIFRTLRHKKVSFADEIGIAAVAVLTYILTEQLGGSGLFAVLILGTFFGNSYVRQTSDMKSFSPFIFKTLEMLIFLLIGFVVTINLDSALLMRSAIIFFAYIILRLLVVHLYFMHYSFSNKLLLALAPKGMILGVSILVLGAFSLVDSVVLNVMLLILVFSLMFGTVLEYVEQKKSLRIDKAFKAIISRRYGRKRDLFRHAK